MQSFLRRAAFIFVSALAVSAPAVAQELRATVAYPVKFVCGPSLEAFQEGIVSGFATTAINILNPSTTRRAQLEKTASRALPYQAPGPVSSLKKDVIGPLQSIEVECNEIRQMLPSQMTEELRAGYLLIRADAPLVVTAVYSARPRDGEISTLSVERVAPVDVADATEPPRKLPDLVVTEIDMGNLRVRCPSGQGSCIAVVPVTVENIGSADAGAFRVRVAFDPGQSTVVMQSVSGLAAGEAQTFQAQTPPSDNCFDPDCMICALADSQEQVAEFDETNNELCRSRQG